jgi:plastocyanin
MRSRIRLLTHLALVVFIAACGGGGGDSTAPGVLTTILLIAPQGTIAVGATIQLMADPKDQHGNPVTASVSWASSNTAVATITSGGLVSGVTVGTATISASSGAVSATPMVVNVIAAGGGTFPLSGDVFMPGNIYSPFVTDIARTGTVRFIFPSDPHNVIFRHDTPGPPADIDILSNTSVSRTFNTAGTFTYDCTVHPGMTGLVVVH